MNFATEPAGLNPTQWNMKTDALMDAVSGVGMVKSTTMTATLAASRRANANATSKQRKD